MFGNEALGRSRLARKIYIHVGLQRCASTLIEHAFQNPIQPISAKLRECGVLPLIDLHRFLGQHRQDSHWSEAFVGQVRAQFIDPLLNDDAWPAAFLTEEGLSITCLPDGPGIDVAARAGYLKTLFEGFDTTVILLVRDQTSFVRSLYALHLQNGGTVGFETFLTNIPERALNWRALADIYADVFGAECLQVLPYNAAAYPKDSASVTGFLAALQRTMGVEEPLEVPRNHLYNPSIKTPDLPIQLAANRALEPTLAAQVGKYLRSGMTKPYEIMRAIRNELGGPAATEVRAAINTGSVDDARSDATPFSLTDPTAFLERFSDQNRILCETYMPGYNPAPFVST